MEGRAPRARATARELAKIAVGQSDVAPSKKDRRFKDDAWRGNPAFRRLAQAYLAAGKTVDDLICDAGLDERAERRVRFAPRTSSTRSRRRTSRRSTRRR